MPDAVRIVLDEDLPSDLSNHLTARGLLATSIVNLRESAFADKLIVTDDDICREVARIPSVLVTLNIRDYADPAFIEKLVQDYEVSVVIVRPPKAEATATKRPQAIRDIVHRHAHRIGGLFGEPKVASANRRSMRIRTLKSIRGEARPPQRLRSMNVRNAKLASGVAGERAVLTARSHEIVCSPAAIHRE